MLSKHEEFVTNVGQLQLVGFSRTMWKVKGRKREEKIERRNHQLSAGDSLIAFIISDNLSSRPQVPTAHSTVLTHIYLFFFFLHLDKMFLQIYFKNLKVINRIGNLKANHHILVLKCHSYYMLMIV